MKPFIHFLKSGEKKKLLADLQDSFGIEKLDYVLVETGKGKIRGFSGSMTRDEIRELSEIANVEIIGLYLIKKDEKFGMRIGLDGTKILEKLIGKNVIEIDKKQVDSWMNGENLELVGEKGVLVVKGDDDMLGCGVSDGKKIINYVPKERRVRRS